MVPDGVIFPIMSEAVNQTLPSGPTFLTAQPHAHVRFRRAIERRALWLAEDAVRELPTLPLETLYNSSTCTPNLAGRFIEEVRGNEPELAAKLRIEERGFWSLPLSSIDR